MPLLRAEIQHQLARNQHGGIILWFHVLERYCVCHDLFLYRLPAVAERFRV